MTFKFLSLSKIILSALRQRTVAEISQITADLDRLYEAAALLNVREKTHLFKFYTVLFLVSMSSALGSYFCFTGISGSLFAAFQAFGMFITFRRTASSQQSTRVCLLVYCAFSVWACVTPWLTWFLGVDKWFVVCRILLVCCGGFGSFHLAFEQPYPFSFIYLESLMLYGLLPREPGWLMMYVEAYSLEVVLRARGGDDDYVEHALHLCTGFPSFVIHLIKDL